MQKAVVPEWAKKWKRKGTVMQMVGSLCCLYANSSHREKGKRNPVVERRYIGVVTPDGVCVKTDVNIDKGDVEVWEAGFTDFILLNAPGNLVAERPGVCEEERERKQEEVLRGMIMSRSPRSYLWREGWLPEGFDQRTVNVYERRLQDLMGVGFDELEVLKRLYLLAFHGGLEARSRMDEEQMAVYSRHGLPFPWERLREVSRGRPKG